MKVYVIYDPMWERVICVHAEEGMGCPICIDHTEKQKEHFEKFHYLEEFEHEIQQNKVTQRDDKIDNIIE